MKSIIKTSFFTVLLMAVFSIGFSNAYADEVNESKTVANDGQTELLKNQKHFKTITLECTSSSAITLSSMVTRSSDNTESSTNALLDCDASATTMENGDTYVVTQDCRLYVITDEGEVFRLI